MFCKLLPPYLTFLIFIVLLGACQISPVGSQTPADLNQLEMTETVVDSGIMPTAAGYQTPTQAIEPKLLTATTISPTQTIPTQEPFPTPTETIQLTPEEQLAEYLKTDEGQKNIHRFIKAMSEKNIILTPEQISKEFTFQEKKDVNGNLLTTVAVYNETVLFFTNENGEWVCATPGRYWSALGKKIGIYLGGYEFKFPGNLNIVKEFFSGGLIALNGQVRPNAGRPPSNANSVANAAKNYQMGLFFHYVAEPGKFPSDINSNNVEAWLDSRLEGIIQVIKRNKTEKQPTYVSFNEAWEGNSWNYESNPLRNKYGEKWIEEYIYQTLLKFINSSLIPNQDFVLVFNDANLFNRPNKQALVFKVLSDARINSFRRLTSDSEILIKLENLGITKPEDINVLLGVQTHTKLGKNIDDGFVVPQPTSDQINTLAEKFSVLGGIIMTEVNPLGEESQQEQFLKMIFHLLQTNPDLQGIILWNVFRPNEEAEMLSRTNLNLFDNGGNPTSLFYSLLPN